jgi:hypothetical protein
MRWLFRLQILGAELLLVQVYVRPGVCVLRPPVRARAGGGVEPLGTSGRATKASHLVHGEMLYIHMDLDIGAICRAMTVSCSSRGEVLRLCTVCPSLIRQPLSYSSVSFCRRHSTSQFPNLW